MRVFSASSVIFKRIISPVQKKKQIIPKQEERWQNVALYTQHGLIGDVLGGLSESVPPEEPHIKERSRTLSVPFLSACRTVRADNDHDGRPSTENISVITYLSQVKQCLLVHAAFLKVDLRGIADLLDDDIEHRALWFNPWCQPTSCLSLARNDNNNSKDNR